MDRSRPVDRCCPLYVRHHGANMCLKGLTNFDLRELLMGCPKTCARRDAVLENSHARERYDKCKETDHFA